MTNSNPTAQQRCAAGVTPPCDAGGPLPPPGCQHHAQEHGRHKVATHNERSDLGHLTCTLSPALPDVSLSAHRIRIAQARTIIGRQALDVPPVSCASESCHVAGGRASISPARHPDGNPSLSFLLPHAWSQSASAKPSSFYLGSLGSVRCKAITPPTRRCSR